MVGCLNPSGYVLVNRDREVNAVAIQSKLVTDIFWPLRMTRTSEEMARSVARSPASSPRSFPEIPCTESEDSLKLLAEVRGP